MKLKALPLLLLAPLALAGAANAALIAYDGYDYGATGGDLTGKNGGTGWSGAYTTTGTTTQYTTTGLTYSGLASTGGAVNTAAASTTISFRNLGAAITTGETWISFLGRRDTATTGNFAGLSLYSGGTAAANAEFSIANGGTANWRILDNNNGGPTTSTDTGIATELNVTKLVVAQILWNGAGEETINLWVNPTLGVAPGAPNATDNINIASGIDSVRFAAANGSGYTYDELRIGTTFASVTVPEPSSAALLGGLGLLALLRRRRD